MLAFVCGCLATCMLSHSSRVQLFSILWTVAPQVPLSMGYSRQEYWSGLPCPSPGDLPDPGIKPKSPAASVLQEDSLPRATREAHVCLHTQLHLFQGFDHKPLRQQVTLSSLHTTVASVSQAGAWGPQSGPSGRNGDVKWGRIRTS